MAEFIPFGIIALVIYLIIALRIGQKKSISFRRQILPFVLFIYLLGLIGLTLFPIHLDSATMPYLPGKPSYNLIPFKTIIFMLTNDPWHYDAFLNISGNVLLFIPFGFLWPLLYKKLNRFSRITPLGFMATLFIETSQYIISDTLGIKFRTFDVDDILLNTLGVMIGFLILRIYYSYDRVRREHFSTSNISFSLLKNH